MAIIFLSSLLAVKRNIVLTILVRVCVCVSVCVRVCVPPSRFVRAITSILAWILK